MKKKSKKVLSLFFGVVLMFGLFLTFPNVNKNDNVVYAQELSETQGFDFELVGEDYYISGSSSVDSSLTVWVIPNEYNGKKVVGVKTGAFSDILSSVRELIFQSNMRVIETNIFHNSGEVNIATLILNEGLEYIGDYAFSGKINATNYETLGVLSIPSTLIYLGESAFFGFRGLNTINYFAEIPFSHRVFAYSFPHNNHLTLNLYSTKYIGLASWVDLQNGEGDATILLGVQPDLLLLNLYKSTEGWAQLFSRELINYYFLVETGGNDLSWQEGYNIGYAEGYAKGLQDADTSPFFSLFTSAFSFVGIILDKEILPGISFGVIVLIPVVFSLIYFILGRKKES